MIIMMVIFISTANHATVRSVWRISIFRASNCRKDSIPTPSPSSSRENALSAGRGIAESNAYSKEKASLKAMHIQNRKRGCHYSSDYAE